MVRKDLIPSLPLPRRMIDYLNAPHYYSEQLIDVEEQPVEAVEPTIDNSLVTNNYILVRNQLNSEQS